MEMRGKNNCYTLISQRHDYNFRLKYLEVKRKAPVHGADLRLQHHQMKAVVALAVLPLIRKELRVPVQLLRGNVLEGFSRTNKNFN